MLIFWNANEIGHLNTCRLEREKLICKKKMRMNEREKKRWRSADSNQRPQECYMQHIVTLSVTTAPQSSLTYLPVK